MPLSHIMTSDGLLAEGEHVATLNEIEVAFGTDNLVRKKLMNGLRLAAQNFKLAGVEQIWIDGSFITSKFEPNDIDGCWEFTSAVDISKLDDCFVTVDRNSMKTKYGLDFFPSSVIELGSRLPFPEFFQQRRDGSGRKGILIVKLGDEK